MADDRTNAFSALSFQEQQEKWRTWRSQRLNFEPAPEPEITVSPKAPPQQIPVTSFAPSHGSLDRLYQRHASASRKTGAFTSTT